MAHFNKFGYCPSRKDSMILTFHKHTTAYHLGQHEPSPPPTKELHSLEKYFTWSRSYKDFTM